MGPGYVGHVVNTIGKIAPCRTSTFPATSAGGVHPGPPSRADVVSPDLGTLLLADRGDAARRQWSARDPAQWIVGQRRIE